MLRQIFFASMLLVCIGTHSVQAFTPPPGPKPEVLIPPYTQPGIIANRGGSWLGSDHLFNLTNQIGVEVEIIGPKNVTLPFTTQEIKQRVSELFRREGLNPVPKGDTDISEVALLDADDLIAQGVSPSNIKRPPMKPAEKPSEKQEKPKMIEMPKVYTPLPFFHVLIMINPIEKGYVVYIGTRLFESIDIKRAGARLDEQTAFQAITWERQQLLISSKEDLTAQVNATVDELTNEFISRYKYFQNLRFQNPQAQN